MKLALLILLISSVGIYAHKRITILDITGEFKESEYSQTQSEGTFGTNVNYTLKPDLKIVRVVDGTKRIWQSLHVGEDCVYCHVTNHRGTPALVLLHIQQFNSFYVVKRYRLFHNTWVPITKRLYNEIAKAINGFEGEEYDLEVDLSQGFDLDKLSITTYTLKIFTNVKLNPQVGYHIDLVRYGDTKLWQRTQYQEEVVEINMFIDNGKLTYVHLLYETYYKTMDSLYFKHDKKWKKITRKQYYHRPDKPYTLIPYKFPSETLQPPPSEESLKDKPIAEHPYDTSPSSHSNLFDLRRPIQFRRFPRPVIKHENKHVHFYQSHEYGYQQKDIRLDSNTIVVTDDDDDTTTSTDPSVIEVNLSEDTTTHRTDNQQIPYIVLESGSSGRVYPYQGPVPSSHEQQGPSTSSQTQTIQQPQYVIQQQQPQYVQNTQQQYQTQYQQQNQVQQQQQFQQQTQQQYQQQPSTTSDNQAENQGYVWYGHDDGSTTGDMQSYSWYGYEQTTTTTPQTDPQYSYSIVEPSTSYHTQTIQQPQVQQQTQQQYQQKPQYQTQNQQQFQQQQPQAQQLFVQEYLNQTQYHIQNQQQYLTQPEYEIQQQYQYQTQDQQQQQFQQEPQYQIHQHYQPQTQQQQRGQQQQYVIQQQQPQYVQNTQQQYQTQYQQQNQVQQQQQFQQQTQQQPEFELLFQTLFQQQQQQRQGQSVRNTKQTQPSASLQPIQLKPFSSSETVPGQICWYQVESDGVNYKPFQSTSNYTYEPTTSGESLDESIYPYKKPSKEKSKEAPKDHTRSDSSQTQTSGDASGRTSTDHIRAKSSDSSNKSDSWFWYKNPPTMHSDEPPAKKNILSYRKEGGKDKQITISVSDIIDIPDDLSQEEIPTGYYGLLDKTDEQLEKELSFFESYYMDFEEEDAYSSRHQKRRGDRAVYFEKISDVEVRGKKGVDIDLFELDDANPNYSIEVQSYYSVPIFKITPAPNKFFKEINADGLIVWRNQDRGLGLVLKAVMINGEFGAVEAVIKRYSNKCYLHYKYERGYYRSIHTPTYISTISCYAFELHQEALETAREEAERVTKRQREAAAKAGLNEKEVAVREYVRRTGILPKDSKSKVRPKRKYPGKKKGEITIVEGEPLCLTSLRKGKGKKRKKTNEQPEELEEIEEIEEILDDDEEDE